MVLLGLLDEKQRIIDKLRSRLDPREVRVAEKDHHARREPRPCGLTVHTGIGCSYSCIYCYVPDMGFPLRPREYPLTPLQMAYAIAVNPYTLPSRSGTMLAFGSVTEPFLPETRGKTLDYISTLKRHLGNPTQISTKASLGEMDVDGLKRSDSEISVLVTIITFKLHPRLEPRAPGPEERLETIRRLSGRSLHVSLFLRPILPGVTEPEIQLLLKRAAESGAVGVVAGSLRVTRGILQRLRLAGIPTSSIESRLPRYPRSRRDQVVVPAGSAKRLVQETAQRLGLKYYPSACAANMDAHGLSCHACSMGPCGPPEGLPRFDADEALQAAEELGISDVSVSLRGNRIVVHTRRGGVVRRFAHMLRDAYKRAVVIRG